MNGVLWALILDWSVDVCVGDGDSSAKCGQWEEASKEAIFIDDPLVYVCVLRSGTLLCMSDFLKCNRFVCSVVDQCQWCCCCDAVG